MDAIRILDGRKRIDQLKPDAVGGLFESKNDSENEKQAVEVMLSDGVGDRVSIAVTGLTDGVRVGKAVPLAEQLIGVPETHTGAFRSRAQIWTQSEVTIVIKSLVRT
jgi:hypothetical protein